MITQNLQLVKNAYYKHVLLSDAKRNDVLNDLSQALIKFTDKILSENQKDLDNMDSTHPQYDRLKLTADRITSMAKEIKNIIMLPSPIGKILTESKLKNGLHLRKVSVPIGVVAVIYESRPNVTVDVFSLCFKAGNACILKGGKEALYSNQIFVNIIHDILTQHNIDINLLYLAPREAVSEILNAIGLVDVCIPRGSKNLIDFVRDNAKIPVIETGAGVVHAYFDIAGELQKGIPIIKNSKLRRVSVCNALDCLLIHKDRLKDLYTLVQALENVEIFADKESYAALKDLYPKHLLKLANEEDFGKEFLSYKMAVKVVADYKEAVLQIMKHGSGHTETIITEDEIAKNYFFQNIDSAVIYCNASTAFTDGAEFDMGSEIGISTQKLHARGPMGLQALTSYKFLVEGNGQIRA